MAKAGRRCDKSAHSDCRREVGVCAGGCALVAMRVHKDLQLGVRVLQCLVMGYTVKTTAYLLSAFWFPLPPPPRKRQNCGGTHPRIPCGTSITSPSRRGNANDDPGWVVAYPPAGPSSIFASSPASCRSFR